MSYLQRPSLISLSHVAQGGKLTRSLPTLNTCRHRAARFVSHARDWLDRGSLGKANACVRNFPLLLTRCALERKSS